ncbi:MAG: hypothetical protein PHQ91_09020 [Thermoanaerobaculaceae bacterium]|nr:hypothetical protein [Thermoanaerobaculaceae bacterium]TAM44500.1 MAG: hypothetical protein EPN53_16425 [Acidobacteriota bacterium]
MRCAVVTYNFDAERWRENQRALLAARRERGELSDAELAAAIEELDRKYDEMVARLDGTFQLPGR